MAKKGGQRLNSVVAMFSAFWFYASMTAIGVALSPWAVSSSAAALAAGRALDRCLRFGMRWMLGVRVEVRGLEHRPDGGALVAAKHLSTYDSVAPFSLLPRPIFVLKRELLSLPVFGFYAKRLGVPIDRSAGGAALRTMLKGAKAAIADGRQFVVFVEGTRKPVDSAPDYKTGIALLYGQLRQPCYILALNTGIVWPHNSWARRKGKILFEFLPPIPPGLPTEDFMAELQTRLEAASDRLIAEGRGAQ